MGFPRSSGILLHPTSLPGGFGVGDFGDEAYSFVDFLADAGQTLWQVLPLGPTGYGDSPYQCFSAFAGSTLLISPERLVSEGLLGAGDLEGAPDFAEGAADFGRAIEFKKGVLREAFERFRRTADSDLRASFVEFSRRAAPWLEDYALYRALKDAHGGKSWNEWEAALARREEGALAAARERLRDEIEAQKFYQFLFFRQWFALKAHCRERGVRIVGDIPIFVAHDSADVWIAPDQFKLDERGRPRVVAGVPPDFFSKTGQLWGNPIYDWDRMRADGFHWWTERVRASLELFDIVRIDHFRGLVAAWEVPGGDETAEHGSWVSVPGRELLAALKNALGEPSVIAEDLGDITPEVERLRDDFRLPSMRVLQFAFGGGAGNLHLPHNYVKDCVVYTGTHDNNTTVGWFDEAGGGEGDAGPRPERQHCLDYLASDGREIHWDFIRAALSSVADTVVIPLQDLLGLGAEARMNYPSSKGGNWAWRFEPGALTEELAARLKKLTTLYGRVRES